MPEPAVLEPPATIPVAGRVQVITTTPLLVAPDGTVGGPGQRLAYEVNRRPWIVPAILASVAVVAVLRRRR